MFTIQGVKPKLVEVPNPKNVIHSSPGFAKKELATFHAELLALCQAGCSYCSSNSGNLLRIRREKYADLTEKQTGKRTLPSNDPALMFKYPDVIERLEAQLDARRKRWGAGETLVFSMLTDGFSPWLVEQGLTRRALEILVQRTDFRIRVLTKFATVGNQEWIDFFAAHPGRFVVGLSVGTTDDAWARHVEIGTSQPRARVAALRRLQDADVPTFGMLCPVFPDMLADEGLERLIEGIRPERCEHVWAEPYNDRLNWTAVRAGYDPKSAGYDFMTDVYGRKNKPRWSRYATDLYVRLRQRADRDGWASKIRYLLYELDITAADAPRFGDGAGVLLQSKPDEETGLSRNPALRILAPTEVSASPVQATLL